MASITASGMLPGVRAQAAPQSDGVFLTAGVERGSDVAQPLAAPDPGGAQEGGQAGQLRGLGQQIARSRGGVHPEQAGPARRNARR